MPNPRITSARLLVVLLVLLAGCGGGGDGTVGESSSSEVPSTEPETLTSSTDVSTSLPTESTATTKAPNRPRIERPSGTPLGQVVPIPPPGWGGGPAYLLLATGNCSELLKLVGGWEGKIAKEPLLLYRAAAAACLQRWKEAQRDYDQLLKLKPAFGEECGGATCEACMRAVLAWLGPLLEAQRRQPDLEPVFVKGTQASPCPEDDQTPTSGGSTTSSSRSTTTT